MWLSVQFQNWTWCAFLSLSGRRSVQKIDFCFQRRFVRSISWGSDSVTVPPRWPSSALVFQVVGKLLKGMDWGLGGPTTPAHSHSWDLVFSEASVFSDRHNDHLYVSSTYFVPDSCLAVLHWLTRLVFVRWWVLLFYRWGNRGPEMLNNLFVTNPSGPECISVRARLSWLWRILWIWLQLCPGSRR